MNLLSTNYVYVTELRGLNAKRHQSSKGMRQSEKADFIESQQHNTIHDRYQIGGMGSERYQNSEL